MKIYISIPTEGNDNKTREKADLIKAMLSKQGHEAVNPFEIHAGKNPQYEDHLCYDMLAMLSCDAVFFCDGWEQSLGCNIEHDVVMRYNAFERKNIKVMYEN